MLPQLPSVLTTRVEDGEAEEAEEALLGVSEELDEDLIQEEEEALLEADVAEALLENDGTEEALDELDVLDALCEEAELLVDVFEALELEDALLEVLVEEAEELLEPQLPNSD